MLFFKNYLLFFILAIGFFAYLIFKVVAYFNPPLPTLRVMTYSSFAGDFGPGWTLNREFKKQCGCKIKWIIVPDSTLFLQRLNLRKDQFKVDLVMGFDQLALTDMQNLKWEPIDNINKSQMVDPVKKFVSSIFIPYNWSPMTLISRKPIRKKIQLQNLLDPIYFKQISLPKPSLSTVGLQFFFWLYVSLGEKNLTKFLKKLGPQLYGLPPSWSTSYSLFQRGHTKLAFSFFSSLLYHQRQKQEDFYALQFEEGHPYQIEFLSIPKRALKKDLAKDFIYFLMSKKAQTILKESNFMFPLTSNTELPFALSLISYEKLNDFQANKKRLLSLWQDKVKL